MSRLPAREAERLWRRWKQDGDAGARDRLIEGHAEMVVYLVRRKLRELPNHVEQDDLVQVGMLALVRAVDRFDPARGASFEQFAWTRVTGAIVDELRRLDWVPRVLRRQAREIAEARERLVVRDGREPSDREIAAELAISVDELAGLRGEIERGEVISLNAAVRNSDDGTLEISDLVADRDDHQQIEDQDRLRQVIRAAREVLTDREQRVLVAAAAGLDGSALGRELGVSQSRVSQLRTSAIGKVRAAAAAA